MNYIKCQVYEQIQTLKSILSRSKLWFSRKSSHNCSHRCVLNALHLRLVASRFYSRISFDLSGFIRYQINCYWFFSISPSLLSTAVCCCLSHHIVFHIEFNKILIKYINLLRMFELDFTIFTARVLSQLEAVFNAPLRLQMNVAVINLLYLSDGEMVFAIVRLWIAKKKCVHSSEQVTQWSHHNNNNSNEKTWESATALNI